MDFGARPRVPGLRDVSNNCATAIDRRRRSEPIKINDANLEMAEHYGCAVVSARVRRPRGKAATEKAVDLCETWALAPLADERFTFLDELNAEVRRLVDALNAHPLSRCEGCRTTPSSARSARR